MMKPYQEIKITDPGKTYWIPLFLLLYILSVLVHLGYFPLNGDEPRRAIVSLEMIHSGNYLRPTTMGWEYYNKPPVYNWFIAFCMKLTGSNAELSVRLPSLISLLCWGYINYRIVRKLLPDTIAALSSLFLVVSFDIYFWGLSNGGEIDVFYSLIVYLQVISLFCFNLKGRWGLLFITSYIFCAIGLLTKGFPSLLFQGFTLTALCVYNRSLRLIFRWQHIAGLLIFLLIAGGYFYVYDFQGSAYNYMTDLLKESFNKSAFGEFSDQLIKKVLVYPFSFFKILLPWSLLFLLLFRKHRFRLWQEPLIRFSLLFIIFNIAPYWFTGHPRMRYAYMFLPFCMILLAYIFYHFNKEYPGFSDRIFKWLRWLFVLVLAGLLAIPFYQTVHYGWWSLAAAILILYILFHNRFTNYSVWYFAAGILVIRFIYASVFIPLKYERTIPKYDMEMAAMAKANNFEPVAFYKKAEQLDLVIDLKLAKLDFGTIPAIPYMAYQMPYYYFRSSGQLMTYDTVLVKDQAYIGLRSDLDHLNLDVLHSFTDPNQNNEEVVLFRLK